MPAPLPKCFGLLNDAYFTNLVTQINGVTTEAGLQALVNVVFADLSLLESTIASQVAILGPISALLSPPDNTLGAIVAWINGLIAHIITPLYAPYLTYASQLTELGTQIASLTSAIEAAAEARGFSISIPAITIGCEL